MKTRHNLELIFKTQDGKSSKLTLRQPKANLTEADLRPSMQVIAASGLFKKEGQNVYHTVEEARYVETIVTDIFTSA